MAASLPLPTLLCAVLFAFTIEFDNESEHRMGALDDEDRQGCRPERCPLAGVAGHVVERHAMRHRGGRLCPRPPCPVPDHQGLARRSPIGAGRARRPSPAWIPSTGATPRPVSAWARTVSVTTQLQDGCGCAAPAVTDGLGCRDPRRQPDRPDHRYARTSSANRAEARDQGKIEWGDPPRRAVVHCGDRVQCT